MLDLLITKHSNPYLRNLATYHYSHPKGFVARSIAYAVFFNSIFYGYTIAGSATLHLPNRNDFLRIDSTKLNNIVNNTFFHIDRVNGKYPIRNFLPLIIAKWRELVVKDWKNKYGDDVIGFETLVELPRSGECYLRDHWTNVGTTIGYSCKRTAGKGTDSWTGSRKWDTENLKPKLVFCKKEF